MPLAGRAPNGRLRVGYTQQQPLVLSGTLRDNVTFGGKPVFIFGNRGPHTPELTIGNHTFIGHEVFFSVSDSVRIGDHCLIASGVQFSDYDGHPVDAERRRAGDPTPPENIRPVVVGDDVWIGTNAIILKGVGTYVSEVG